MIVTGDSMNSMMDKGEDQKDSFGTLPESTKDLSFLPKPFFIMDWLEKIIPKELEVAQQCLYTPEKEAETSDVKNLLDAVLPRELFTPSSPSSDSSESASPTRRQKSHFYKKSITIGNAWNAKGLQKAQKDLWQDALLCWKNALEIRLQVLGDNHLDVANTYNNIGIAQGKLSRYKEASNSLHQALEIRKNFLGDDHTEVAATLHNIGNVYQQKGDFVKAVEYYALSKQIQETQLGKNHVQVARAAIAIGRTKFQAAKWEEAMKEYNEALETLRNAGVPEDEEEMQDLKEDIMDVQAELGHITS